MGILVSRSAGHWTSSEETLESQYQHQRFVRACVLAVEKGDSEALHILEKHGNENSYGNIATLKTSPPLLCLAASLGRTDIAKFLIERGANIEETDSHSMTPLHHACCSKSTDCVRLLVARNSQIDPKDVWSRTPLIKALVHRCTEAAKILLDHSANPNAADKYNMTPVTIAINYNIPDFLRVLVNYGADINQVNKNYKKQSGPPLYLAINNQSLNMVEELLTLGATTKPRPQDYTLPANSNSLAFWTFDGHRPYINPVAPLPHSNAVTMAMSELVKRGKKDTQTQTRSMMILMALLSAHGHPLGPEPDILMRVLFKSQSDNFSILLHKLHICSSSCQDGFLGLDEFDSFETSSRPPSQRQLHPMDQNLNNNNNDYSSEEVESGTEVNSQRYVTCLQTQACRVVRHAAMRSGHNVVWAVNRLHCPAGLKTLILLKDIDRAFSRSELGRSLSGQKDNLILMKILMTMYYKS